MKLNNFESYILKFDNEYKYSINDKNEYEALIKDFNRDYNKDKLEELTAEQMVYGNNDRGLYHRLKEETKLIGSIDVRNTNYGVFEKDGKIQPNNKFGDTVEEASNDFRKNMIDILEAAMNNDENRIAINTIPNTLKYKMASIYNPDFFLPVYSIQHVNFFLKCLGYEILGENSKDYFPRTHILLDEKNSNSVTKKWSNHKFARLLYYLFGSPKKTEELGEVFKNGENEVLISTECYMDKEIVFVDSGLSNVKKRERKFNPDKKAKKIDFEKQMRKNSLNGSIAEEKVIEFEKERLKKIGRKIDINKIKKVSDTNDAAGYDIKSINEDGSERYIEVKSTVTSKYSFNLSVNEHLAGKHYGERYWIYFVSLGKEKIEIRTINNPFSEEQQEKLDIKPVNYQIDINFEK